ncbi:AAA family ATPase [Candidatus Parcubacteria bacterium]|nr:AAA family ATPase [Candidatus Parcubacteria bacterium]
MKLKTVRLKNFKRFDDLIINLGDNSKKIIALVGPNGCGKSSVFDAFEEKLKDYKGASQNEHASYFSKLWHSIFPEKRLESYNKNESIIITEGGGATNFDKKSFYIRSAYRFTPKLKVDSIKAQPDIIEDHNRPYSSNAIDSRMQSNYERLLSRLLYEFEQGNKTGTEFKKEFLEKINKILENILDVKVSSLGNVGDGKGQLFFEKENSKNFPYENLSSGEKEVVDIIIDLVIKTPDFNNTVYCIDEPELHLNTAIQRKLLTEIEKLVPDNCQLWIATHSIGFLRALQEELKDKSSILDFSVKDYFNGTVEIKPIATTRDNWHRIFKTALEDLTGLLAPKKIIYCEGEKSSDENGDEKGLDATIYNQIFSVSHPDTLFVSSGGNKESDGYSVVALQILNKAFKDVELYLLKDRDKKTKEQRQGFLDDNSMNRMLKRHEIENYLFDKEILKKYHFGKGTNFDELKYESKITDIINQDLKSIQQDIQHVCGYSGNINDFKIKLSEYITSDTDAYKELEEFIFKQ